MNYRSKVRVPTFTINQLDKVDIINSEYRRNVVITIEGGIIKSDIYSYTYKKKVTLMVSAEWLKPTDKVLIIDDFLANGEALRGLCEIVSSAGAELVGMGVAVEKGFQPGGKKLRDAGIPLYSLAIIEKADGNGIVFRDGQEEK